MNDPMQATSSSCLTSKITAGYASLGKLKSECFGKAILVLDLKTKSLHLIGGLYGDYLPHFRSFKPGKREETILAAVSAASVHLSTQNIQQDAGIQIPDGLQGRILGGTAMYFDGQSKIYIDGKSPEYGPLTKGALTLCMNKIRLRRHFGTQIIENDRLWLPSIDRDIALYLRD